jgi:hypothetical protein
VSDDVIGLLDRVKEVDVETASANGTVHRVPIWVVVVDGAAYVASVNATKGRWYRELSARDGALVVEGRRVAVHAVPVADEALRQRVSDAFGKKYRTSRASLASMQRPEVLATTLRLELLA